MWVFVVCIFASKLVAAVLLSLSLISATPSAAVDLDNASPYIAFNLGSYHLNASQDFNEVNPGLGVGVSMPSGIGNFSLDVELGQYRNSIKSDSYYVMSSLDHQIYAPSDRLSVRLGAFGGFAHYPGNKIKFKNSDVPTIGNWVLAAGLQTVLRVDNKYDVRLRVMPAGKVADALFTLQLARRF